MRMVELGGRAVWIPSMQARSSAVRTESFPGLDRA
jgi:hypothetical protein